MLILKTKMNWKLYFHGIFSHSKKLKSQPFKVYLEKNAVAEVFFQLKCHDLYTGMVGAGKAEMQYFSAKKRY